MRRYRFSRRFEEAFAELPGSAAALFEKKLPLFLENMHHPAFRTRKMQGTTNPQVWEASLTMDYRWTFEIEPDGTIFFRNIGTHDILKRE